MSIRKRSWINADGKKAVGWQVDYRDQHGRRQRKQFERKADADAFDLKVRVEVGAGVHTPANASITIAEAGQRWLAHCDGLVADGAMEQTTVDAYRQHVALHVVPYLGGVKLPALTAPMVPEFQRKLRADGRSPAMVRKARIALGALVGQAQEDGLVAQNVVRTLGRDKKKRRADRSATKIQAGVDIPLRSEIHAIEAVLPGTRYRALLTAAIFTGLRASELRGLRRADVDLNRGEINVRQRADRHNKIGPLKSAAGFRTVPLMPMVVAVLGEHRLARAAGELDLMFPNSKGKIDHLNTIVAGWQAVQVAAGVVDANGKAKYSGLHSIRHFFASWCINRKADGGLELDPKRVQQYMGHATIGITMDVYGHLFPRADREGEMAEAQRLWQARGIA